MMIIIIMSLNDEILVQVLVNEKLLCATTNMTEGNAAIRRLSVCLSVPRLARKLCCSELRLANPILEVEPRMANIPGVRKIYVVHKMTWFSHGY